MTVQDRFKFRAGFTVSYIDDNENDRDIQLFIKGYFSVDCGGAGIVVHSDVINEALNNTDLSLTEKKSVIKNLEANYCENDEYWFIDNLDFLEQCVDLKDKNDKLIYEGDIFKAEVINSYDGDENLYKTIYGQVSWFDIECCFSFASYQPSDLFEIEVIGNVHENGNLLENKNE